jgi:UDP-N-acetylglucosamine--N-acetylmuramyl-(pentapeptide) pyrophosphoryl-undecaprenol N-acetylglucosamine transferase
MLALAQSLIVMARHRPAAVLGMGGFVSGPGGLAAWLMRRPLVIHEQNAIAGLTNRLLARLARVVLQAFPGSFPANINCETVGNPVRAEIAALADPAVRFGSREGPLRLLVLGGSQGALTLNKVVPKAIARLPEELRPVVRHQAGSLTLETARKAYEEESIAVELLPYIEDMADAYAWADLVVCRAGALTVAELAAAGLPAIFVPYAAAADDHQTANAQPMADAGTAAIIAEADFNDESLASLLKNWLRSRDQLMTQASKARLLHRPDALSRISSLCLELAGANA